jgi:TolA-binding protein
MEVIEVKKRLKFLTVLVIAAILLAGCSVSGTSTTTQLPSQTLSTGTVEVRVIDGPPGYEVQEVEMQVGSIEIHMAEEEQYQNEGQDNQHQDQEQDENWITLQILEDINPFILTDLQNGHEQTLALGHVDPGKYTQIRMGIDWVEISYTKDGEQQGPVRATLPSDKLKFVRPFNVEEEETTVITFDFIVDESVVFTGAKASAAPKIIFKPVIKLDIQQGGQAEETDEVDGNVDGEITGVEVVDNNEGVVSILPIGDSEVALNINGDTEITLDGDVKTLSELETAFLALVEGEVINAYAEYYTENMNAVLITATLSSQ